MSRRQRREAQRHADVAGVRLLLVRRRTWLAADGCTLLADLWEYAEEDNGTYDQHLYFWYASPMHVGYSKHGTRGHDISDLDTFLRWANGRFSALAGEQLAFDVSDLEDPSRCTSGRQVKIGLSRQPVFASLRKKETAPA
jgi:hypothetical protein